MGKGIVYFVGAGPGHPKLITVKGLEVIKKADVIVYDRLVSPRLLQHAKPGAKLVYCGKEAGFHSVPQEEIHRIIIREAKKGRSVVRLKGGDPSIFGRVGEEAQACASHFIPFEIVPGVTSGIAAAAYAGIPLTHRGYNGSVAFVTGHRCEGNAPWEDDWEKLSKVETLVIYMGVKNLPYIQKQLLRYGKPPSTPVALVKWGTMAEQETIVGELSDIVQKAEEARLTSPAVIIIGEVVKLRETLNWHETKPLFGRTVLFCSDPLCEAEEYVSVLEELGADVFQLPSAAVPNPSAGLEPVIRRMGEYRWMVFSDVLEVRFWFRKLKEMNLDVRNVRARVAAVGDRTAAELADRGIMAEHCFLPGETDVIPLRLGVRSGERILWLHPDYKDPVIERTDAGAEWTMASLYRVRPDSAAFIGEKFGPKTFDAFFVNGSQGPEVLEEALGPFPQTAEVICIGFSAAAKAKALGWRKFAVVREGPAFALDISQSFTADIGQRIAADAGQNCAGDNSAADIGQNFAADSFAADVSQRRNSRRNDPFYPALST